MPAMLGAKADARPVAQPETAAFRLPFGNLQTLPPPDPLDHRQADLPAGIAEQSMDTTIAIPTIIRRQRDDVGGQPLLVCIVPRWVALRRAGLAKHPASPPLRYGQHATDLLDRLTATGGAQKFSLDASWRIALSSARSATSFFNRAFSRSRSFIRRA